MTARAPMPAPAPADYPTAEFGRRPRRRRGFLRKLAAVVAVLVTLGILGSVVAWIATPGVGDARTRTDALLAEHNAPSLGGNVPSKVAAALVATEDSRFYSHSGLDARGAIRGALTLSKGGALGGATIDAQLAKLLYTHGASGFKPATEEVVLAVKIDQRWTKKQILSMYFDAAYFGHGAYGLTSAARIFFGVAPSQLSWTQATMLAGLVNAPSAYDPTAHLHLARDRQQHVLDRLVATHVLTKQQAQTIFAAPLHPAIPFAG